MITRSITRPVTSPIARAITAAYGAWNPRALFANGEQGVWYDPNDLSALFQDSAGTTPVTAAGQPVGLMLDKRLGLVRGQELQVNGGFSGATGWTTQSGWSISGGKAVASSVPLAGNIIPTDYVATIAGRWYEASVTVDSLTQGIARLYAFDGASNIVLGALIAAPGVYSMRFRATNATTKIYISASTGPMSGVFDSVTFRELPGNHATQPTAASRPMLRQNATTGAFYLETDGSDDWMSTSAIDFTGTDKVSVFTGVRKLSDAARAMVVELGSGVASAFRLEAPSAAASPNYVFTSHGSTAASAAYVNAAVAAPHSSVLSCAAAISLDTASIRVNGTQVAQSSGDQGSGNYGNHPLYLFRRGGTSLPFNGHFYGLTIVGRLCTDAETLNVERLYANKTGVTLA